MKLCLMLNLAGSIIFMMLLNKFAWIYDLGNVK